MTEHEPAVLVSVFIYRLIRPVHCEDHSQFTGPMERAADAISPEERLLQNLESSTFSFVQKIQAQTSIYSATDTNTTNTRVNSVAAETIHW